MENNEKFLVQLGKMYEETLQRENDFDFIVNDVQMEKLCYVADFFASVATYCGGTVEPIALSPRERSGGVTATFTVFDLHGDQPEKMQSVIKYLSAITIDVQDDQICISVTIPDVYVPIVTVIQ